MNHTGDEIMLLVRGRRQTPNFKTHFLLTHVDHFVNMKLPASLNSDPYRHRIGTHPPRAERGDCSRT